VCEKTLKTTTTKDPWAVVLRAFSLWSSSHFYESTKSQETFKIGCCFHFIFLWDDHDEKKAPWKVLYSILKSLINFLWGQKPLHALELRIKRIYYHICLSFSNFLFNANASLQNWKVVQILNEPENFQSNFIVTCAHSKLSLSFLFTIFWCYCSILITFLLKPFWNRLAGGTVSHSHLLPGHIIPSDSQPDPMTTRPHGLKMGPNLTRAYFWPAVNKRPDRHWTGYFLNQPEEIFLSLREKNWKIWYF